MSCRNDRIAYQMASFLQTSLQCASSVALEKKEPSTAISVRDLSVTFPMQEWVHLFWLRYHRIIMGFMSFETTGKHGSVEICWGETISCSLHGFSSVSTSFRHRQSVGTACSSTLVRLALSHRLKNIKRQPFSLKAGPSAPGSHCTGSQKLPKQLPEVRHLNWLKIWRSQGAANPNSPGSVLGLPLPCYSLWWKQEGRKVL